MLNKYDHIGARADLLATTLLTPFRGDFEAVGALSPFTQSVSMRPLHRILDGIPSFGIDECSRISFVFLHTLYPLVADLNNADVLQLSKMVVNANRFNAMLRNDLGSAQAELAAECIYEAIESNWPHSEKTFNHTGLCAMLGINKDAERVKSTPLFSDPATENTRRMMFARMCFNTVYADVLRQQRDIEAFELRIEKAALASLGHSVYTMASDHNPHMNLNEHAINLLTDAYAATLSLARYFAMMPTQQNPMPLTEAASIEQIATNAQQAADYAARQATERLSEDDRRFFAAAFAERACFAASGDKAFHNALLEFSSKALGLQDQPSPLPPKTAPGMPSTPTLGRKDLN